MPMRMNASSFAATLMKGLVLSLMISTTPARLLGHTRKTEVGGLLCRVLYIDVYGPEDTDLLECEIMKGPNAGHSYSLELSSKLVEEHESLLRRGAWYISIPGAHIDETYIEGYGTMGTRIEIPDPALITTVPAPDAVEVSLAHRGLTYAPALGVRNLMVVRVSTSDASPTYSASQLATYYFDTSTFSMARQYYMCSSGLLRFTAFSTPVVDVRVSGAVSSFSKENLVNAAITAAQNSLGGVSLPAVVMHVAFILPPGTAGMSWFATGQVGAWRSVFNDKFGGIPDTMMHEIGHNFGLGHAGTPGDQYGDETSLMGYGDFRQFAPSKCFNACDHYNLGWFSDRTVVVDPSNGHQLVTLATFVDYRATSGNQPVVLMVGNYCLSYNMAKGVNGATQASINQVSVALAGDGNKSTRISTLDETTNPFQVSNYNGGSQTLVIRVCQRGTSGSVDYATIAIGIGSVSCTASNATPPPPSPTPPPPSSGPAGLRVYRSPPTTTSRAGVFINAGTSNVYTDSSGVVWSRDLYYSPGGGILTTSRSISNTNKDQLFQSQRWGPIQYNVPVANGAYQVALMFAEIHPSVQAKGVRVFDVYLEGSVRFKAVDIFATVGSFAALTLSTTIHVTDGTFTLALSPRTGKSPVISAFSLRPV